MSKAEKTKALILEKVAPIFNIKGYAGTSLSDMVAATGLTKGSIYGNFANKDAVALAVFDYNLEKLKTAVIAKINQCDTAKDKLLVYADCYERFLLPPFTEGGCPILNTAIESDDTHPRLRGKAATAVLSWKNKIIDIIEKGITDKEFCATTNAERIALTMIAMIEGTIMIAKLLGDTTTISSVMQSMKKMIYELN